MLRAARSIARVSRSFSSTSALVDLALYDLPGVGLTPPAEYMDLPKLGLVQGSYEAFRDVSVVRPT
jgi:hypothetical protein